MQTKPFALVAVARAKKWRASHRRAEDMTAPTIKRKPLISGRRLDLSLPYGQKSPTLLIFAL